MSVCDGIRNLVYSLRVGLGRKYGGLLLANRRSQILPGSSSFVTTEESSTVVSGEPEDYFGQLPNEIRSTDDGNLSRVRMSEFIVGTYSQKTLRQSAHIANIDINGQLGLRVILPAFGFLFATRYLFMCYR